VSDGKTHRRVNIITGGAIVGGSILINAPLPVTVAAIAGSVAGTIISPDMDLNAALPASFMTKIPGVRIVWGTVWRPYQLIFKHRSFWSHFPIVGTTGRVLYLMLWLLGTVWILSAFGFDKTPEDMLLFILDNGDFFAVMFLVWCVLDFTHFVLDI